MHFLSALNQHRFPCNVVCIRLIFLIPFWLLPQKIYLIYDMGSWYLSKGYKKLSHLRNTFQTQTALLAYGTEERTLFMSS